MPVLDWTLPRKKKNLSKFHKVDVISMTDEDSFATAADSTRPAAYGTLRKIKSLNDLLEDVEDDSSNITKSASGQISTSAGPSPTETEDQDDESQRQSTLDQSGSKGAWADYLRPRGDKKPTGQFIVSGFSTLSRRAGGGMEVPDINMQAVRVFLRNGTHKTVRTTPNTTCKEVLQGVLKKLGLQESIYQYGLYIQYAISDGRMAPDDEIIANINPNTWDSVTRIYLCRKEEFSSAQTRSRCVSFARDFLEIEQNRRSDMNFAYDITEFTNIQKRVQVSTHRGRMSTVAVHQPSAKKNMVTNKLIVESFADCWAKANRQLNIGSDYTESIHFKTVKIPEPNKRKLSVPVGTINRTYTIERGKERRPALAKMFSTGSLETSKSSCTAASPLLQNVNSNNSNNNLLIPCRVESMANINSSTDKCHVHPFARPLEHSSSLPVINISTITEEDDEIYSMPSVSSLSQSDKSELLHKLSPFSSFSSLDLYDTPRMVGCYKDKANTQGPRFDVVSPDRSRSPSPNPPRYRNCLLVSSKSLPDFSTNEAINTSSDIVNANQQLRLECSTYKSSELLPTKPVQRKLSVPPPLPPRKYSPPAYHPTPAKEPNIPQKHVKSTEQDLKQIDDNENSDSIGQMPKCKANPKLRRRRSISLSDLRSSLERKSLKLTSTVMKIPGAKSRQVPPLKLLKQPEDYQNVSIKELMAIRAAVTSPTLPSPAAGFSSVNIRPKSLEPPAITKRPPAVPKRRSSLFMSSSSDKEIVLQYKRMSSDSLYSCRDIETITDDQSNCDATVTPDDITLDALDDQNSTNQAAVHPASPSPSYDHLDFSRSANTIISNRAVTTADKHSEIPPLQKYIGDQSLVEDIGASHDPLSFSCTGNWLAPSTDSCYHNTVHFGQKQQATHNKPYNVSEDVTKSQNKSSTTALKKPSCSHIYEDLGPDYEDIDEDDDDEDYVIMESKKTTNVPPPPPLPPPFSKIPGVHKTQQQQVMHLTNKVSNKTKPQLVIVSSVVEKNNKPATSQAPKSPTEPQIRIMVGKTNRTGQLLSLQDELKNKTQTRSSGIQNQLRSEHVENAPAPTIQGCQHGHYNTTSNTTHSTVSKQLDRDRDTTTPSELEANFLGMKNTYCTRKEMVEKATLL